MPKVILELTFNEVRDDGPYDDEDVPYVDYHCSVKTLSNELTPDQRIGAIEGLAQSDFGWGELPNMIIGALENGN